MVYGTYFGLDGMKWNQNFAWEHNEGAMNGTRYFTFLVDLLRRDLFLRL
jgi:hypothetical protein